MSDSEKARRELVTRVAVMYYLDGLTQESIAEKLGLSRPKVWRLLGIARDEGIVNISVNVHPSLSTPVELELMARFGLSRVLLVPDQTDEARVRASVAQAAASLVDSLATTGTLVAVGMGRNVRAVADAMQGVTARACTIVSAIGGSSQITGGVNSNEIASRLASALNGDAEGIYAPAYAETRDVRNAFITHSDVARTLDRARESTFAVVGIGDADDESLVVRLGCITTQDMANMRAEGAVGDILGSFFNENGEPVAEWIEERVVGISRQDIRDIPTVIAVAPERTKVAAIRGALSSGLIDALVTSLGVAREIIRSTP